MTVVHGCDDKSDCAVLSKVSFHFVISADPSSLLAVDVQRRYGPGSPISRPVMVLCSVSA